MKNYMPLIILMVVFSVEGSAQTISTKTDGEWNNNATWNGNNNAPGYVLSSNSNTAITIAAGHKVYTQNHNLTITGNNGIINVNGDLTINGNLVINANGWDINVADDGLFVVTGDVAFSQPGQGNASPDLKINGIATIGGNISGTGDLLGDGELYMTGTIAGTIKVNLFDGNIVYGTTDISLPAPSNLDATEIPNPIRIFLNWDFPTLTSVITDRYTFLGFQVFTNNGRPSMPTHESQLIESDYIPSADIHITAIDTFYLHNSSFLPGETPKYYVRAAYWDTTTSQVVYSIISVFDFLGHGVLPISLVSLKAKKDLSSIAVSWTTATEINNLGFEIQRSDYTGNNWQTIGFVDGHYNHNGLLNYTFTDHAPASGINYYRLRQIDYDGKWEIFGPVAENMRDASAGIQVIKSAGSVYVQLPEQGLLEIYDMGGRKISSYPMVDQMQLPLTRGSYILRFSNGMNVSNTKIVL